MSRPPNHTTMTVYTILTDVLGVAETQLVDAAHLRNDLGADSLDLVQLIVAFRWHFDITVEDAAVRQLQTVGEITTYLNQQMLLQRSR